MKQISVGNEQRKVWSEPRVTGRSEMRQAQSAKDIYGAMENTLDGTSTGPLS